MAKSTTPPARPDPPPKNAPAHDRSYLEIPTVGVVVETIIYSSDGRMSVASVFVPGVYVHPTEDGLGELRKL